MSVIKWSPFFFDPFEDADKYFEGVGTALIPHAGASMIPPIDMYETAEAIVVETPLAGVDPNKVEISIENGTLAIKGASERKTEVDEKDYYRREIKSGSVFRKIALPKRIKEDAVEASFENGILKVTLPKLEEKKNTVKITVKKKN